VDAEENRMDKGKENLGKDWVSDFFCEIPNVLLSRDLSPRPWTRAYPGCKLTWRPSCESLVAIRPFVW